MEFPTPQAQNGVTFMGNQIDIRKLNDNHLSETSIEYILLSEATDSFWQFVFWVFPAGKFDGY